MKLTIEFKEEKQLQDFFLDSGDLFEKHSATVSPDEEGKKAIEEVTEKVEQED